jgi:hypothetical protein
MRTTFTFAFALLSATLAVAVPAPEALAEPWVCGPGGEVPVCTCPAGSTLPQSESTLVLFSCLSKLTLEHSRRGQCLQRDAASGRLHDDVN